MLRMLLIGVVATAIVVLSSTPAAALRAPGWMGAHSEMDQQTIVNEAFRGGPQGASPYAGEARQAAEWVYQQEKKTASRALADRLLYGRMAARIMPVFVSSVPEVSLLAGAAEVGWKVGADVNAKLLHIGIPKPTPYTGYSGGQILRRYPPGTNLFGATTPGEGYVWGYDNGRRNFYFDLAQREPKCDPYGVLQLPEDSTWLPGDATTCGVGSHWYNPLMGHVGIFFVPASKLRPVGPVKDFTPTDAYRYHTPAPPVPGLADARAALAQALEEDGSDLARSWFDWTLSPAPQPEEDPARPAAPPTDRDNPCIPGSPQPEYNNITWAPGHESDGGDPRATVRDTFSLAVNPTDPANLNVKLFWGDQKWGERHIRIEHGWTTGDVIDTRLALGQPHAWVSDPGSRTPGAYRFYRYYTGSDGATACTRRVVVRLNATPNTNFRPNGIDQPVGVTTSFAYPRSVKDPTAGTAGP